MSERISEQPIYTQDEWNTEVKRVGKEPRKCGDYACVSLCIKRCEANAKKLTPSLRFRATSNE